MLLTWVDGEVADTMPADDRGLYYADGAFETMSCHDGYIQHEGLHRSRLTRALKALGVTSAVEHGARIFVTAGQSDKVYPQRLSAARVIALRIALRCCEYPLGNTASTCWS